MLILAIDSSASAASAAVLKDGRLSGEFFVNTKQTHSQTLMPMVQGLLDATKKSPGDFDLMAVSSGPGSFTGIRIGVSCIKGMAFPYKTRCCGVSTLEAIAWGGIALEGAVICAVMDARCKQVYNALFSIQHGVPVRICEDRALSISELKQECEGYGSSLILSGDGAVLCYEEFQTFGAQLAPEAIRYQRASSVALAASRQWEKGETTSLDGLLPLYLRMPQAERELKNKQRG